MKQKAVLLISSLLLIIVIILALLKCYPQQTFRLNDEYYGNNSLIEIDSDKLALLENDESSFVLFVYQPLCSTFHDFDNNIAQFQNTYKISFNKILFANIKDTKIANYVKYCPSLVIYHQGQIVAYLDANSNKDAKYYKSVKHLTKWFAKYIILK